MAAAEALTAAIDQVIALFNAKAMDLPDGFFDRRTQFVLNGSSFETLLGRPENDPLVLMLARGPAGFRFAAKALQHAVPDAKLELSDIAGSASTVITRLVLSGTLRGTGEALNTAVDVTLTLAPAGHVELAEASIDPATLDRLRIARLAS